MAEDFNEKLPNGPVRRPKLDRVKLFDFLQSRSRSQVRLESPSIMAKPSESDVFVGATYVSTGAAPIGILPSRFAG